MIRANMCIIRAMATAAIVGASGYAGQETLDRVLAHPGARALRARLGLARGAAGRRARPAARPQRRAPHPALHHERGRARLRRRRHLPLPRARGGRSARRPAARRRRRPLRRAPLRDAGVYETWYGFEHPQPESSAVLVVRAPRAQPADGPADREPGLLRDRGAARARADPRRDRARQRRGRREVGDDRRGPLAAGDARTPASCSRTSRRTASASTSTRPRSRSRSASRSRSSRTCCPCGAG